MRTTSDDGDHADRCRGPLVGGVAGNSKEAHVCSRPAVFLRRAGSGGR
jgi:hypothetical protein